jgi:hypothetical protein
VLDYFHEVKGEQMNAKVTALYKDGKKADDKGAKTVEGDLNLSVWKHPVTGRVCYQACILGERGLQKLPDLFDAQCVIIAAYGIRLRGVEFSKGREVAQEWWCVPDNKGVTK